MILELFRGRVMVLVIVPAVVLIRGHCCALMLELLFWHASMPAECSAVLTVVWAYECACMGCRAYVL